MQYSTFLNNSTGTANFYQKFSSYHSYSQESNIYCIDLPRKCQIGKLIRKCRVYISMQAQLQKA